MSEEAVNLESIMRRVKKLLAIAQDERANPQEAASAAQQAEKIMRKYQIDNAAVLAKSIERGEGMGQFETQANMKRDDPTRPPLQKNPPWAGWLAFRVAKLNDCEAKYGWMRGKGASVVFFGYESDAQVSQWTFDYLVGALINAMKQYQRGGTVRSKAESESYRRGFVLAMCATLQRMREEKDAEARASAQAGQPSAQAGQSYALLVLTKAQAIEKHFGEVKYGEAKTSASKIVGSAFHAGREAGSKVDVARRGICDKTADKLRLN